MRIRRRRKGYLGAVIAVIVVVIGVAGLFGYILDRRVRTSPEYTAAVVSYLIKSGSDYVYIYMDSSKELARILYLKKYLYDPDTGVSVTGERRDDLEFFDEVFGLNPSYEYYIDLDGANLDKFSRVVVSKRVNNLEELVKALRSRRGSFLDSFRVDNMAASFKLFSNLNGPALLKLMDGLSKYGDIDSERIESFPKNPVKIVVGKEKEEVLYRLYLPKKEKENLISFFGVTSE